MTVYTTSVKIEASPEDVFDFLVDPERMVQWMGDRAALGTDAGAPFEADINGVLIRGEVIAIERPHLFVVSWGELGHVDFPPGSSQVTFTLRSVAGGTELVLRHDQLPPSQQEGYSVGWENYLGRLAVVAAGGDPGPDPFASTPTA